MGSPSRIEWPEGYDLAADMEFEFPKFVKTPLDEIIKNASEEAIDLMEKMMAFNPKHRPIATDCLQHPYFDSVRKYFEPAFKEKPQEYYPRKYKIHNIF